MEAYYPYLFPLLVVGLVAWQLKIGETFRMRWIPSVSKAEHKVAYWAIIAFQVIVGGFGTYEGFTYGDSTTVAEEDEDAPTVQVAGMTGGAPVALATKAAAPTPPPTPPDPKIRDSAIALHRARKFAQAVELYDVAVSQAPTDPELVYWRGVAHWNTPNGGPNALRDFRKVIELDPAHWNAHINADRILVSQGRWDQGLAMWNAYLGRVPNSADAYFERSGTNRLKGDTAAMRADAAKACELGKREACR
jgi:tetratricopeptide (TPR) repeat protein